MSSQKAMPYPVLEGNYHGTTDKKVALVYRLDRPGGIQSCAFSIIKGLNSRGVIPDILWDVEPDWALMKQKKVEAKYRYIRFRVPTLTIDKLPDAVRYLAWIADPINGEHFEQDYDFFYIFYNGFLVQNGTPHVRYMPGPPLIPELETISPGVRGLPFRSFRWIYQNYLKKLSPVYEFHSSGNYVTISQFTADFFEKTYGCHLPVISPPVDLGNHNFDFEDLKHRDTLTFFSRFVNYKRPELVLDLAKRYPEFRCTLMGGVPAHRWSYFRSLQTLSKKMGIENVTFIANPSNQQVKDELSRTRFYIFPVVNEHFGMTTVEAIASGAIPFVHDSGGQKEIVVDPRFRFQDVEIFTKFDCVTKLSDHELNEVRKRLVTHVRDYSEEAYISKMLSFIDW